MIHSLLSGDYPRSRVLSVLLIAILVGLALGPFLFSGTVAFRTMGLIVVFILVVAAYDLMLGYTHVVSFAHLMFFGFGAYGVAMALDSMGSNFTAIAVGTGASLLLSIVVALLLGLLSLRVKAIFFALVTLAIAFSFMVLVNQLYTLTGGEDGMRVAVPRELGPAFRLDEPWTGFSIIGWVWGVITNPLNIAEVTRDAFFDVRANGRLLMYYVSFVVTLVLFIGMLRLVNSPFGRVLLAIRENEFRAEALGYRTVYYRTAVVVLASALATIGGVMFALVTRYITPESTLDFELAVFVLLMCVMGGMGTLYGAVVGATVFLIAQNYLQDLLGVLSGWMDQVPVLAMAAPLFGADRWLLWFGVLFVLSVYFFPTGIVGQLREWAARRSRAEAGQKAGDNADEPASHGA
ncbi:branched-chain amino acid ABC transporter permease [Aquisalimonas asiatica]|uniref:Amino acid/amide ABC transporter membrane protein 2, HAAT family (TC 3.A.1.4.-) n=1 Tax=Aquisalimonas asiatica TaxID=406100 RepID=A0A1H8U235_9GAMM|nr:branched-chain amino acid ABC transporter permease [Aquisalimonas asiatica]SEO96924.1 amino acid/amide ABC transporter membrane protein 2, HAAT family (TC 3.A.1.4.-) [Aquisalimonas asiatica]